jgi:hypothetical protein
MARITAWRSVAVAALAAAALACAEEVTAPGHCPDLCPADSLAVKDTILTGIVVSDTSVRGYSDPALAPVMLVSDLDSLQAHAIVRFLPMPQKWFPTADSNGAVPVIDSIALEVFVRARDTLVKNLVLRVHRLPALATDSTVTWASSLPYFNDSTLLDTIPVPDSVKFGVQRRLVPVAAMQPQQVDSFVRSIGLEVRADAHSLVTLYTTEITGQPAHLKIYAHGKVPADTTTYRTLFDLTPTFDTWVQTPAVAAVAPHTVTVGNNPAARAFLRFAIPAYFVDSATVVRATLLLTPTRPAQGFPGQTFQIEAQPVLRDYGGKSLVITDTTVGGAGIVTVGATGTVLIEVGKVLRAWRGVNVDSLPRMINLRVTNEGYEIGQLEAVASGAAAGAPQLQISFVRPFRFGVP